MKKLILKLTLVSVAGMLFLASCTKKNMDLQSHYFDVDLFESKIKAAFDDKAVGHGYGIYKDGQLAKHGGDGNARMPQDNPEIKFTGDSRLDIASSTKTITAMAVMKELYSQGKNEEEKIYKYCPSSWVIPDVNKQLSFKQVLGHTSGLIKYGGELDDLKKTMETPNTGTGTFFYNNANYALCRVLLSYLDAGTASMESGFDLPYLVSAVFEFNIQSKIFKPAGLVYWDKVGFNGWDESNDRNRYTLNYNFADPSANGSPRSNHFYDAGAGGLHINGKELAQVMSAAETGKSMPKNVFQVMKDQMLGFDGSQAVTGGTVYTKGGDYTSDDIKDQGAHSRILFFPNNVQVAWLTNSNNNSHSGSINAIINAYQTSWK